MINEKREEKKSVSPGALTAMALQVFKKTGTHKPQLILEDEKGISTLTIDLPLLAALKYARERRKEALLLGWKVWFIYFDEGKLHFRTDFPNGFWMEWEIPVITNDNVMEVFENEE